mgnify:CR=1 FL=1
MLIELIDKVKRQGYAISTLREEVEQLRKSPMELSNKL